MKRAVFPGSFDPITRGHEDIIRRSLDLFDEIIVAVGVNSDKKYLFDLKKRLAFIEEVFRDEDKIRVDTYSGLTVGYCRKVDAGYIIRGLRNPGDFEFEKSIAQMNRRMSGVETVFLLSAPENAYISSSIVREVYRYGGDVKDLLPDAVVKLMDAKR